MKNFFLKSNDLALAQPFTLLGIEGLLVRVPRDGTDLWDRQAFFACRDVKGEGGRFDLMIRYDDESRNKCNTFAVTRNFDGVTGPMDEELAKKHWPEIAHLVKWHLCAEGKPFYYVENTLYQAALGNLDLARQCAHWPDAPTQILNASETKLTAALEARLPAMQQQFRDDLAPTGLLLHP